MADSIYQDVSYTQENEVKDKLDRAEITGFCWCGCGRETDSYWVSGHDKKAQDYLVTYFLKFLQRNHTGNKAANLVHALGFDPEVNRLKAAVSKQRF